MRRKFELWKLVAPGYNLNQDTDICCICFDIKVEPMKCKTCKISFCKYCANKWGALGNKKCPTRCSEKWEYEPSSPLEIKLQCFYQCGNMQIPDNFISHNKQCPKNPYKQSEAQLQLKNLCNLGHQLSYISEPKLVPLNIECASCQIQKSICRSACTQCRNNGQTYFRYCCQCRIPKGMTKTCCPAGHADFYIKPPSRCYSTYCDMCSVRIRNHGNICVQDKKCDFAICKQCYSKLQKGPGEPLDLQNYEQVQASSPNSNYFLNAFMEDNSSFEMLLINQLNQLNEEMSNQILSQLGQQQVILNQDQQDESYNPGEGQEQDQSNNYEENDE